MSTTEDRALQSLLRRIDEVRGLAGRATGTAVPSVDDPDTLIRTLGELVDELERSHRRLIETNVQLVSLREVASHLVMTQDLAETTRTVTRYLCRAYGFEEASLLLVDADSERLSGTWTSRDGDRDRSAELDVPLRGDAGAVARAFWLNRTVVHQSAALHPPARLADGHPLRDTFDHLSSAVSVPLQRSHAVLPSAEPHELCGARCILGDMALLAPPPGPAADVWAHDREERQRHCMTCELMPLLGVISVARRRGSPALTAADSQLLESIALSIAPVVENARLYQELRKSERFREHVLDSMASALVAVNMKGEILTFNHAAEALLGAPEADAIGEPFGALFGADGESCLAQTLEQGQELSRREVTLRARTGAPVAVSLSTSLLRNERRNVYGAIATFVDLRPLKQAEEHARRLDRLAALGRFTSSVAHEIRNPLTGIAAGVQYLQKRFEDDAPGQENIVFILDEIRRLDRIVQDLFDITHPRGMQVRTAPVEETIGRAIQVLRTVLETRRVDLDIDVRPRTPAVAHDADQMEQVFINLIKNAAEASAPGHRIEVRVRPAAPGSDGGGGPVDLRPQGAVIEVRDHGSGISPDHQKTIFEPFFTTKQGGTGLGLYICHDIVKRHGGMLSVQSTPGRGTTFTVELPLEINGGTP
jgi:PAS domain S-box-containing protein